MPTRNVVPVVLSTLLLALVCITGWSLRTFSRYQPYSGFFNADSQLNRQFIVQLSSVDVRGRQAGRRLWRVHAHRMTLSLDRSKLTADGVTEGVLLQQSKPFLRFVADHAIYTQGGINTQTGNLEVSGRIHIASTGPVSPLDARVAIDANHAIWTGASEILDCPESVRAHFVRADWPEPVDVAAKVLNWNNRSRVMRFTDQVTMLCPAPNSGDGMRMSVSSSNVAWEREQSLVTCNAPARIVYPLANAQRPIVIDAQTASFDQRTGIVTCPTQATADLTLPHTNSNIRLIAAQSVWNPKTGQLTAPRGAHANVASLGEIECDTPNIDTRTRGIDFAQIRLAANSADVAPTTPDNTGKPPATDPNRVYVEAPEGGHWDEQQATLTLRGPVKFTQGDAVLTTIGAVYNRKTNTAVALAPITVTDPENTITGDHGQINFRTKIVNIDTNVRLKQIPKAAPNKEPRSDADTMDTSRHEPSDLTCDKLVYNYHEKTAQIAGHVVIKQKHRTVTADTGDYDARSKVASLEGNVVGTTDDNKILKAPKANVSIREGDQWIEFPNQVNFEFTPDKQDNPRPTTPATPPAKSL